MPHPALSSPTPLHARFLAQSPDGKFHLIATVAEAAQYLTRLPRRYDGWCGRQQVMLWSMPTSHIRML